MIPKVPFSALNYLFELWKNKILWNMCWHKSFFKFHSGFQYNEFKSFSARILSHTKKKSSGVDNWSLDEFFEEFICGRWFIYLEQTKYHLCWSITCWLYSSPADDIQLKQMILIWRGWYSSRADNILLKQMILSWRGQYSYTADNIHPIETIFIQKRWISSMMVDSWNYNKPLEMIFNHWGS
jgi:hypothetical protein